MARFALTLVVGAIVAAGSASAAPAGDGVLVIGDSLSVGGETYLDQELAGVPVTTDAEIGRGSAAGLEVLAANLAPEHGVVVFALGSNDDPANPGALAANLEQANEIAGGRCLVVATVSVEKYSGSDDSGLNEAIRGFAASNPNVRLVEWEELVTANPQLLTDGAHATPEGYEARASLLAQAIGSCETAPRGAGGAGGSGGGDGIPKPDADALAEGDVRPEFEPAKPKSDPIGRDEAFEILADAVASQIAIGALGPTTPSTSGDPG